MPANPKLTKQQEADLDRDIESDAFRNGELTTAEIGRRYGLSWKHAARNILKSKARIERRKQGANPPTEAELNKISEEILREDNTIERDEITRPVQDQKPQISLIDPPATPKTPDAILPADPNVLDGNKWYCATCIRAGRQTIIEQNAATCPVCGVVLLWRN